MNQDLSIGKIGPMRLELLLEGQLIALYLIIPFSKALIEVLLVSTLVTWFCKRFLMHEFHLPKMPLLFSFLIFWFIATLSIVHSPDQFKSLKELLNMTEYMFIAIIISETLFKMKRIQLVIYLMLMGLAILALDGFYQYLSGSDFILGREVGMVGESRRITATFKHANSFGGYLAAIIPVVISLLYVDGASDQKRWFKGVVLLILGLLFISIFLTYSRGAWCAVIFGMIFYAVFKDRRLLFFLFGFIVLAPFLLSDSLIERAHSIIDFQDVTLLMRMDTWKSALEMFQKYPLVGHGLKSFSVLHAQGYAHNSYIQLLAEVGLLGLCSFLYITLKFFIHIFKQRQDAIYGGLGAGLFAMFVHCFFDNHFYSIQLAVLMWMMIGMGVRPKPSV